MLHLAILRSTRKVYIKVFSSLLYVMHSLFNQNCLQRGMKVMFKSKDSKRHWVPYTTICRNVILPIISYNVC